MLKINGKSSCVDAVIEFDEYIPFTIEFSTNKTLQPLYWRVGNGSSSLAEFGINKNSGELQSVTLTSLEQKQVTKVDSQFLLTIPESEGIPLCDLEQWIELESSTEFFECFFDEFNSNLFLEIGKDYISLLVQIDSIPVRYIRNGNVLFGVDKNSDLSVVVIKCVSDENIKNLKTAVAL
jgi:hypothetical protein